MEPPRQRFACDRCHALKLRCPRVESSGASCARCSKAGSLCIFSAPARLGRPLGSSHRQQGKNDAAANHHHLTTNDAVLAEDIDIMKHLRPPDSINNINNNNNNSSDSTNPLDDFISDILPGDAPSDAASMDAWNNASFLLGSGQLSVVTQHELPLGPLHFNAGHHSTTSRTSAVSPEHQLHLPDTILDQYGADSSVEKCLECSTAMKQTAALDAHGDTVQDIMSQLSSLVVTSHGHRRRAKGQLRVLQLRLNHKHDLVEEASSVTAQIEMAAAGDCFSTRTLIRTHQSFRDVIRRAMKISPDGDGGLPSPISNSSRDGINTASGGYSFGKIDRRYSTKSTDTSPTQRGPSTEQSKASQYEENRKETPYSRVLALKLILNCYLEILDIFATTFAMIRTTIEHYSSFLPLMRTVPGSSPSSGNMLDASFSIFTANQLTHRLFEMTKRDMQDMWDRHSAQSLESDGDISNRGTAPKRVRSSLQDSVIEMTFQLSWEKEASITRAIEDINEQLNGLMDMS